MTFDDTTLFAQAGETLLKHLNHKIALAAYGDESDRRNIAFECEECHEVLLDFSAEVNNGTAPSNLVIRPSPSARINLVTELHYADGDVGAYDDLDARALWAHFTKAHASSHILVRPNTEAGQQLSNTLMNASKMVAALNVLVDTINATGGVVQLGDGTSVPRADEEWTDLAFAYRIACDALGMTPHIA